MTSGLWGKKKTLKQKWQNTKEGEKRERRLSEVGRRGAVGGKGKPSQLQGQPGILEHGEVKEQVRALWRHGDRQTDGQTHTRELQQGGLMGKEST